MDKAKAKLCEAKSFKTKDGTPVSGHMFMARDCVLDEQYKRYYFVDECKDCGTTTAGYIDADKPLAARLVKMYQTQHNVAGVATSLMLK